MAVLSALAMCVSRCGSLIWVIMNAMHALKMPYIDMLISDSYVTM